VWLASAVALGLEVFAGALKLAEQAPQMLDLALVVLLLALGNFEQPDDVFEVFQRFPQVGDDLSDMRDGLLERFAAGRGPRRRRWCGGWRRGYFGDRRKRGFRLRHQRRGFR
jgi:hypothetical protein